MAGQPRNRASAAGTEHSATVALDYGGRLRYSVDFNTPAALDWAYRRWGMPDGVLVVSTPESVWIDLQGAARARPFGGDPRWRETQARRHLERLADAA